MSDFLHTFSMASYHKWDVKNGFAFVLQFFSIISDGLGGVHTLAMEKCLFDRKILRICLLGFIINRV